MKRNMDQATRERYIKWKRNRIIKRVVVPGVALLLLLTVGITTLIIHLTREYIEDEPLEANIYETIDPCENLNYRPLTSALERYGEGVAIYFENLTTGCSFEHNIEEEFFGASLIKAPFALWLYMQAERGYIDLDETIYFTEADHLGGSGIIRHNYTYGQAFTIRRLIALSLYESDNVATQMLRRTFRHLGYTDSIAGLLGDSREFEGNIFYSRITAEDIGFFARAIYAYIESGQTYSVEFRRNLLNNQFPFITAGYPVASKTGWYHRYGGAWHDMSIIYAPSPYILVILSANRTGTEEDHQAYQYISRAFEVFNGLNFPLYDPSEILSTTPSN